MHDLGMAIGHEAVRHERAGMQLDAIERRDPDRAETRVQVSLVGARRLPDASVALRPLAFSPAEVLVLSRPRELVEALDRGGKIAWLDAKSAGQLLDALRSCDPFGHRRANAPIGERETVGVLLIEDQVAGKIAVAPPHQVVFAQPD